MNYSELSDFEINKAVAIACGYAEENCEFGWSGRPDVGVEWNEETGYPTKSFNYCNSWADAGPIIKEYLICLSPGGHDNSGMVLWTAFCKLKGAKTTNPLKSAMIAFLMSCEAKSE